MEARTRAREPSEKLHGGTERGDAANPAGLTSPARPQTPATIMRMMAKTRASGKRPFISAFIGVVDSLSVLRTGEAADAPRFEYSTGCIPGLSIAAGNRVRPLMVLGPKTPLFLLLS